MAKWCKTGVVYRGGIILNRTKAQKNSVRLSVSLDEGDYAELSKLAATLDLSAAWMIRRAVSEFVVRHRNGIESDLTLAPAGTRTGKQEHEKKQGFKWSINQYQRDTLRETMAILTLFGG